MNSRKAIAFSAGLFVAAGIVVSAEFWCAHQMKQGKLYWPPYVAPLAVEALKKKFPHGIFPEAPPSIEKKLSSPLAEDVRLFSEQVYVPIEDTKSTFHSFRHIYRKKSGEVFWDIPFYFDRYKRRIVPADQNKKSSKFLAMFGDSNIVGYGLPQDKTLANFLSQTFPELKIYNYSGIGFYPYQILSLTKKIDRTEEIPEKEGAAFYFYMSYHLRRNMVNIRDPQHPFLELDEKGELVEKKNENVFLSLLYRSSVFQYYRLSPRPSERDYQIQTSLIQQMRKNLESNGIQKFYVVIHPFQENLEETQVLMSYLHEAKIPFIYFGHWNMKDLTEGPADLVVDAHYSGEANQVLAKGLEKVIRNL